MDPCLDLSYRRQKVAAADENSSVVVYDLEDNWFSRTRTPQRVVELRIRGHALLFRAASCHKTGDFPVHRQKLQGFVVEVQGQ